MRNETNEIGAGTVRNKADCLGLLFAICLPSQMAWRCCVTMLLGSLIAQSAACAAEQSSSGFKGEYILMRNNVSEKNAGLCTAFTRNLNEFRHLPFKECHPRLSPKYPEFSRPQWEEVPYDLALAERAVRASNGRVDLYPEAARRAEKHWQRWLLASDRIRKSEQARMWRTRIDFDGDGLEDIIIRMVPDSEARIDAEPPYNCDYNQGEVFMSDTAHPEIANSFIGSYRDIIYFSGDGRYYGISWNGEYAPTGGDGPQSETPDIGGTAGVRLSQLNWDGHGVGRGLVCVVHWVPTGRHRPLKPKYSR